MKEVRAGTPAELPEGSTEAFDIERVGKSSPKNGSKKKKRYPSKLHKASHRKLRRRKYVETHEKLFSQREEHVVYAGNDAVQ